MEEPPENKGDGRGGGRKRRTWLDEIPKGIIDALAPWAHPELIFDVETTTDALSGQRAKVGFWQQRGLKYEDRCNLYAQGKLTPEAMDVCWREGVFYNKLTCTLKEVQTIRDYAARHGLRCMEMADFIRDVFYRQAKLNTLIPEPKMIIRHNPVFDIGAISRHTGKSCDEKLYGALSLGLCNCRQAEEIVDAGNDVPKFKACGYHPNIKIKKLGPGKHIVECGAKFDGCDKTGKRKYVDMCIEFLDTKQLARALLGPCDGSLEALCRMLKTSTQKLEAPGGHGQEIDDVYLDYARNDVQCTWELYVKLRDLYRLWGIKRRITRIYSEASIGKGVYKEFGVQSFFGYDPRTKRNTRTWTLTPRSSASRWRDYSAAKARLGYAIRFGSACSLILEANIPA